MKIEGNLHLQPLLLKKRKEISDVFPQPRAQRVWTMKKQIRAESRETTALYSVFPLEAEIVGIFLVSAYVCALERVLASAVYVICFS